MYVQSILTTKGNAVATIPPEATLGEATGQLRDHGVGALVVSVDGTTVTGIVSERDVVRALAAHGTTSLGRQVSSIMSRDVVTCAPEDTVHSLMELMTERRVRHLPVLDRSGALCGIVSIGDVVKHRLGELETENSHLHDYISGRV